MNIDFQMERNTLSEQVAERIEQMILNDPTRMHDKLPSEAVLSADFKVSRPVIREALTILKARGLVVQRQGGGSFIACPDLHSIDDYVYRAVVMSHIDFKDVYEARIFLEKVAVRQAAQKATDDDIAKLKRITDKMAGSVDDTSRTRRDLRFHQAISDIGGNKVLNAFQQSLNTLLQPVLISTLKLSGAAEDGVQFHRRIIDAIEAHDAELAEELMHQHLSRSMRNYELMQMDEEDD